MSSSPQTEACEYGDLVGPYALAVLERAEAKAMQSHLTTCVQCSHEHQLLSPVTNALADWRAQVLPPLASMWNRLLDRIGKQSPQQATALSSTHRLPAPQDWPEPGWEEVAVGIRCKLLSTDVAMDRVSMLVRLAPDTSYPPHRHAAVEELYLLEGELWIEDRQLLPGDFNRAEPGTSDQRVWSPTGCMCLLITSPSDELR